MREIVIIVGIAILSFIFLKRYLEEEKGIKLWSLFFRPKNLIRHHQREEKPSEVTVEEFIPAREHVDEKLVAKADSLVKKADIVVGKGDDQEAEKFLIQALSLDPSCIEAYKRLAYMYLRQGQFSKAESIYRKLVVTITDDPAMFSNLGMALFSQQKLEDAKNFYKKALDLDKERPGRFFSLAQIHYELEEFEDALDHFRRAVEMDERNLDYLLTLAHFYVDREMPGEARTLLDEILLIFPENEEALKMRENLQ